jgi:DNA-binding PadR family transcriptional regulator
MNVTSASAKELFVLGRLSLRPTYGHEIMRTLGESRADLWAELSEKHVYYILRKLEREGLVSVEVSGEGSRSSRRVFSATTDGLVEFERLLRADGLIESMPYSDFDVVFGMLVYTDRLTPAEKTGILMRRAAHLRNVIAEAGAATERSLDAGAPSLPTRVFEKVIRVAAAELGWLEEVLDDVLRDGWPEGRTSAGFSATGEMA